MKSIIHNKGRKYCMLCRVDGQAKYYRGGEMTEII